MNEEQLIKIAQKGVHSKVGIIGNNILYNLCKKYPYHKKEDEINAKIWLIGRAYAAAIERRKKYRNYSNDDFYEIKVIPTIIQSEIDEKFDSIRKYNCITEDNILEILKIHKYLLDLFTKISGLQKRSLASKYLHFHFPSLFFIYDSRANSALKIVYKNSTKKYDSIINNSDIDKNYANFFCGAYQEMKNIEKLLGQDITIRQFDNILIMIANEELRNKKHRQYTTI